MSDVVETPFGSTDERAITVEFLSNNGGAFWAIETHTLVHELGIKPMYTPLNSPQSNGMAEVFVNTFKRDYVGGMDHSSGAAVLGQLPDAVRLWKLTLTKHQAASRKCGARSSPGAPTNAEPAKRRRRCRRNPGYKQRWRLAAASHREDVLPIGHYKGKSGKSQSHDRQSAPMPPRETVARYTGRSTRAAAVDLNPSRTARPCAALPRTAERQMPTRDPSPSFPAGPTSRHWRLPRGVLPPWQHRHFGRRAATASAS